MFILTNTLPEVGIQFGLRLIVWLINKDDGVL